LAYSYYANAIIIFVGSLPACFLFFDCEELKFEEKVASEPPKELTKTEFQHKTQICLKVLTNVLAMTTGGAGKVIDDDDPDVPEVAEPPKKLATSEILHNPQIYLQFLTNVLAMAPPFAIKWNLSVLGSALYGASVSQQNIFSFIYLFAYALSRLATGLLLGKHLSVETAQKLAIALQIPCFIASGLLVKMGGTTTKYFWGFVVLEAVIGLALAAFKSTIYISALVRWNSENFR